MPEESQEAGGNRLFLDWGSGNEHQEEGRKFLKFSAIEFEVFGVQADMG